MSEFLHPTQISISDFDYFLPDEQIALFPLPQRDQSKLLVLKQGDLSEDCFSNLPNHLEQDDLLLFNNTKVIRARLLFTKETGSTIEIFCLEPIFPTPEIQLAFQTKGNSVWKCYVGNNKRWKETSLLKKLEINNQQVELKAERLKAVDDAWLIRFSWDEDLTLAQIIEAAGKIPLPPYIHRETNEADKERYQTIYAKHDGSVAAPTAGLHFTKKVMESLYSKGVQCDYLTLHVGAGTFKPVSTEKVGDHQMHAEQIIVKRSLVEQLIDAKRVIPVGTTSMRTLESLFWFGAKLKTKPLSFYTQLEVEQWDPYSFPDAAKVDPKDALMQLLKWMEEQESDEIHGYTRMMIAPGYQFRLAKGIITNFHQPKSTLLLLISAMIGNRWKDAYQYALEHNFRFLSYGDSCLFLP